MVTKIDLSKAFNKVSWFFLRIIRIQLGLCVSFTSWVMSCISIVSYHVLLNKLATHFFTLGRELRQGFPLSPFLFLLVVQGLGRLIKKARHEGYFKGIKFYNTYFLTHLPFLDDILVFNAQEYQDIKYLRDRITLFQSATGMVINMEKSSNYSYKLSNRKYPSCNCSPLSAKDGSKSQIILAFFQRKININFGTCSG